MAHENSPSAVMYADLKEFGLSNRDVASALLDTDRMFCGMPLRDRIDSRTQLSRTIVHVAPGEMSPALFVDFGDSSQVLASRVMARLKREQRDKALDTFAQRYAGPSADAMVEALAEYGDDGSVYRNTLAHISHMKLANETDRALLYFMLFIAAGCTGDSRVAAQAVEKFASERVGSAFRTTLAEVGEASEEDDESFEALGLMRIVRGKLKGASSFYVLATDAAGTEIGTLASGKNVITDVDADVSRRHARIYQNESHWYIEGLKSTNGTTVISGDDKVERVVEPPRSERPRGWKPSPFEIFPTDTICLGSSTRFMVFPVME